MGHSIHHRDAVELTRRGTTAIIVVEFQISMEEDGYSEILEILEPPCDGDGRDTR